MRDERGEAIATLLYLFLHGGRGDAHVFWARSDLSIGDWHDVQAKAERKRAVAMGLCFTANAPAEG